MARKHIPIFRVVLTDSKNSTKSGKYKEVLGTYNLITDEKRIDAERVKYWMSKGAQLSGTVHNYLVSERIITGKKINVLPKRRPIKKADAGVAAGGEKAGAPAEAGKESSAEKTEAVSAERDVKNPPQKAVAEAA